MLGSFNKNAVLAVDLGTDAVRLIGATRRKGRTVLEFCADQTLPEGPVNTLPERHLAALEELLKPRRLPTRRILAAMPTSLVLTRTVRLDKAQTQSTEEQIIWTMQNTLPFDPSDLLFDHWLVGEAAPGKPPEAMVVATQASVVEKYLRGFEQLKLQCIHLDVAPCALATLLQHTAAKPDAPLCTLALSPTLGFFAVADRGKVLFWRPFDLNVAPRATTPGPLNLQRVGDELMKCFSHMAAVMQLDKMAEMLVFGQSVEDQQVSEFLHRQFHIPVRCPSPFDALPPDSASDAAALSTSQMLATHYCTAVGLALQNPGGLAYG